MNAPLTAQPGRAPAPTPSLAASLLFLNSLRNRQPIPRQLSVSSSSPSSKSGTAVMGSSWQPLLTTVAALALPPRLGGGSSPATNKPKRKFIVSGSPKNRRFLILVYLILKDLTTTNDHALKHRVQWIVRECNKLNRRRDPRFRPLQASVEVLLKAAIGETRWNAACQRLECMLMKRRRLALLQQVA